MFTYFLDFLHEPSLKVEKFPETNPAWLGLTKAYISYNGVNVSEKAVCKTNDSPNRSAVTDSTNLLVVFPYNTWYTIKQTADSQSCHYNTFTTLNN